MEENFRTTGPTRSLLNHQRKTPAGKNNLLPHKSRVRNSFHIKIKTSLSFDTETPPEWIKLLRRSCLRNFQIKNQNYEQENPNSQGFSFNGKILLTQDGLQRTIRFKKIYRISKRLRQKNRWKIFWTLQKRHLRLQFHNSLPC